jgi:pimeloyl-ACP methyl ester carboxylesterase
MSFAGPARTSTGRQPDERTPVADYVTVNGVRTWYEVHGEGEPLVLLHGGFSDSRDFGPSLATLTGFQVYLVDRRGHGHTPDVEGPVSIDMLAEDVIAFIDAVVGGPAHLAGYSAGGVVAAAIAVQRPDLVRKLVLISTALQQEGWMFLPDPDGEMPAQIVDAYAEVSPDGCGHFPVVQAKFSRASRENARIDPTRITCPTLVMGSDDDIVHLPYTVGLYQSIPLAQLVVVPGTSHVLLIEKPELCGQLITDFLNRDPAPFMPIHRASQPDPATAPR